MYRGFNVEHFGTVLAMGQYAIPYAAFCCINIEHVYSHKAE